MSVPAGTRFIGIQPGVDMAERKSSQANSPTEVYTIEDIQSSGVPYVGATQDVDLGEYELKAGQIELDQSPTGAAGVAVTRWNNTIGSTETTLKGGSVLLKNGVDLVARVVNKVTPNTTLTKAAYQVVKVSGAQGQRLAVDYAQANDDNNSADTLGVVIETIPTNQEGFIMTVGQLEGINTTGSLQGESWLDGDVLYLSPTVPGAVTKVKPNGSTGHIVIIGYVEYAHVNNGKIYVKIMNGWELDELHNVFIDNGTLANNQVLTYESSTQLWKNKTPNTGITVGTTSSSGTDGRVFFQAGGVVQQDANFTFDNTLKRLTLKAVNTGAGDIPFAVQNSAGTANIMQVAGDNTMTFLSSGGKIIFSQNIVDQGSVISLRRDYTNQEIIRLDGTNNGGITVIPLSDGSTKRIVIGNSFTSGNAGAIGFTSLGATSFALQCRNQFHNYLELNIDPNSGISNYRFGNFQNNTNFFNVHGRNAGGTGLTTNPVFTINSSGTVGIGTEASTPGARLDVRAQGALSTDIAFRVRNSADSVTLTEIQGTGNLITRHNSSGSSLGLFHRNDTTGFSLTTGTSGYGTGNGIEVVGSTWILASGARQFAFTTMAGTDGDLWTFQNNGSGAGKRMSLSKSGSETFCWSGENYSIGGNIWGNPPTETNSFGIKNGTAPSTNATDAFKLYSADITAGNAAPHFRTENGAIVKVYQETTAVAAATLVSNAGTAITDTDTFDGYTLKQIVKALRNQGLLA